MGLSNEELSKYWDTANTLRENLDAAEYKHIVLGLIFLKYISDRFEDLHQHLIQDSQRDVCLFQSRLIL